MKSVCRLWVTTVTRVISSLQTWNTVAGLVSVMQMEIPPLAVAEPGWGRVSVPPIVRLYSLCFVQCLTPVIFCLQCSYALRDNRLICKSLFVVMGVRYILSLTWSYSRLAGGLQSRVLHYGFMCNRRIYWLAGCHCHRMWTQFIIHLFVSVRLSAPRLM